MTSFKNLDWQELIQTLRFSLENEKQSPFQLLNIKKINYGLQIEIHYKGSKNKESKNEESKNKESKKAHIRLYQNKKTGLLLDLSLIQEDALKKEADSFFRKCLEEFLLKEFPENKENEPEPNKKIYEPCIGTDEAGKGDYFGPLVVSAVYVDRETIEFVQKLGVRDSKTYSDSQIKNLKKNLSQLPHALWIIEPLEYNQLYEEYSNLNQILALAHARVIQKLIQKLKLHSNIKVLTDQFAKKELLEKALKEALKKALKKQAVLENLEKLKENPEQKVQLEQRVRAESHPAVACASILARGSFLESGAKLFSSQNVPFIKGASDQVIETAKKILSNPTRSIQTRSKYSLPHRIRHSVPLKEKEIQQMLRPFAKLHFKCTKKIPSLF